MANADIGLNPRWRQRIAEIGKTQFVREEMLRLGFLHTADEAQRQQIKAFLDASYPRLRDLRRELETLRQEIASIDDIDSLLQEIRRERIARVRQAREARQVRQAAEQAQRRLDLKAEQRRTPRFLGQGVSTRLLFSGGDATLLAARALPPLATVEDLAALMQVTPEHLLWLCYERAASSVDHYTRFEIPKKSGGKRLIAAPKPKLRAAQEWILTHLLDGLTPAAPAMAFRPGRSILDNARPHLQAAIVVRQDLKDFFPSITFPRVRGYFEHLGYNPGIATVLGLICTDAPRVKVSLDGTIQYVALGERALPQGACTSPALANLLASPLDRRLSGFCAAVPEAWTYTRYADDLTFSTNTPQADVGRLLAAVERLVTAEGFQLNDKKTAVMRAPNRQVVTGLLVGDRLRLSRRDLRRIRAFCHQCDQTGLDTVSQVQGRDALAVARGLLAYVAMVMPDHAARLRARYPWL